MIFIPWWELPGDGLHPLERIKLGQQALQPTQSSAATASISSSSGTDRAQMGPSTKIGRRCAYDVCACGPGEICIHCHDKKNVNRV